MEKKAMRKMAFPKDILKILQDFLKVLQELYFMWDKSISYRNLIQTGSFLYRKLRFVIEFLNPRRLDQFL